MRILLLVELQPARYAAYSCQRYIHQSDMQLLKKQRLAALSLLSVCEPVALPTQYSRGTAGTLEVKAGSHSAHEEYWDRVSPLSADRKASIGDWYLFEPEARAQLQPFCLDAYLLRCLKPQARQYLRSITGMDVLGCLPGMQAGFAYMSTGTWTP